MPQQCQVRLVLQDLCLRAAIIWVGKVCLSKLRSEAGVTHASRRAELSHLQPSHDCLRDVGRVAEDTVQLAVVLLQCAVPGRQDHLQVPGLQRQPPPTG